jgi:hypothetical protein
MFTPKIRHSSNDSRPRRTYLAALLAVIALLVALNPGPAFAMPPDPIDPPPWGEEDPFTPPDDGFWWSVPARFGLDANIDLMIDYHWRGNSDPANPNTYDPAHIYPHEWPIILEGCRTDAEGETGISPNVYLWHIEGQGTLAGWSWSTPNQDPDHHRCAFRKPDLPAQGNYTVQLRIYDPTGVKIAPTDRDAYAQDVYIKDYLIVSIGDSIGSGEGNPDIPQDIWYNPSPLWNDPDWIVEEEAKWQDARCHRSALAGAAQAALAMERYDEHTSVTFLSFACSGATVGRMQYDPVIFRFPFLGINLDPDWNKPIGSGILGRFRGSQMPDTFPYPTVPEVESYEQYLPSQIAQLTHALQPPTGQSPRRPDALIIQAGGNDMFFGDVTMQCLFNPNCWNQVHMQEWPGEEHRPITEVLTRALATSGDVPAGNLPASLRVLNDTLDSLTVGDVPVAPLHTYITQYPELTRDDNGNFCRMLDDIFWPNPLWAIDPAEAETATTFALAGLNNALHVVADEVGWTYVDGIASYVDDPSRPVDLVQDHFGKGHGYCASDNWIRRAEEAEVLQGPMGLRMATKGTLHPTARAHQIYKDRLLHYMIPDLTEPHAIQPPAFYTSFTVGALTSVAGSNGWFVKSCTNPAGTGTCEDKVVLKVMANAWTSPNPNDSQVTLRGAASRVNGVNACPEGVVCTGPELINDNKTAIWTYTINAEGFYTFAFTAQDSTGQGTDFSYQIKADLRDPLLAAPAPLTVEEGGSVVLQAQATDSGGRPVDIDWDLNNDGTFETTDEQATFAAIDGPAAKTVRVRAKDSAGRVAQATTTVSVLNVAPTLSNLALSRATVNEGGSVTLTGNIRDLASADSFSLEINWGDGSTIETVKRPAGATSFSIAHTYADDNPTATASDINTISVKLSDDDGASASGMTTVTVNNLAPAAGAMWDLDLVSLGSAVTQSLPFTDAGIWDTHSVAWGWGDGTGVQQGWVQESNVSGRAYGSHVYAQPGAYTVQATLSDDDGGQATATYRYAVVYDPSVRFAAGGGWINSPAGAYVANAAATGRANFGFVCQSRTGGALSGNTEFQFAAAGLNFLSTKYTSLSISLAGATVKGEGTINGAGQYLFQVTAVQGDAPEGDGDDKFRIKIWDKASGAVVYDNTSPAVLGGGEILMRR